jgi:2-polyprenyl-3-methyl-5-hydroxy-6-metoxy-1,4-benzoquinol methylase
MVDRPSISDPLLDRARGIVADYRFAAGPIAALVAADPAYPARAEHHLARLHRALDRDDARFDDAIEAFVELTVDVMRMQDRYFRTGQFDAGPDGVGDALYADEDVMGRRYLCGLYLAQIFWPNHLEKLRWFESEVVPRAGARDDARVLEIGTGPGTYGLTIGRVSPCAELHLNDISPLSIDLVRRMAAADPLRAPESLRTSTVDFLALDVAGEPWDVVLFSEIVEHLREPSLGLARLHGLLASDGFVFFSTATNAAFYDHTIAFETVDEVRALLAAHDFAIASERTILAVEGPDGRDVLDYVAILTPAVP